LSRVSQGASLRFSPLRYKSDLSFQPVISPRPRNFLEEKGFHN
jgi:hypothetical protein